MSPTKPARSLLWDEDLSIAFTGVSHSVAEEIGLEGAANKAGDQSGEPERRVDQRTDDQLLIRNPTPALPRVTDRADDRPMRARIASARAGYGRSSAAPSACATNCAIFM